MAGIENVIGEAKFHFTFQPSVFGYVTYAENVFSSDHLDGRLRLSGDAGPQASEPFFNTFVPPVNLFNIINLAYTLCAERGNQQGYAGTDVGRHMRRPLKRTLWS